MNTIVIAKHGTDLSSRSTGGKLRRQVAALAEHDTVVLDFEGVRSVSHSFADEFLAVLIQEQGEDWFRNHVKLVNHAVAVRTAILDAIQYRLTATGRAA
jgi:hypothetical protein